MSPVKLSATVWPMGKEGYSVRTEKKVKDGVVAVLDTPLGQASAETRTRGGQGGWSGKAEGNSARANRRLDFDFPRGHQGRLHEYVNEPREALGTKKKYETSKEEVLIAAEHISEEELKKKW
jgi:hypothetical protein